jgi:hypothetical protein
MKKIFLSIAIILLATIAKTQSIKIKNNIVFIDGVECLKVNNDPNNVAIMDLSGNELIFIKFIHDSKYGSLYNKITFLDQKLSFTSKSYIFTKKLLLKKLLEDKTLENCKLNPGKVEKFVLKFDEDVEKPIIIIH